MFLSKNQGPGKGIFQNRGIPYQIRVAGGDFADYRVTRWKWPESVARQGKCSLIGTREPPIPHAICIGRRPPGGYNAGLNMGSHPRALETAI